MKFVVCHACKVVIQIGGDQLEVASLLSGMETYSCITPLCRGRMVPIAMAKIAPGYTMREIPVRGFFRSIHGFGPGVGDPASLKRLKELLLSQRVVDLIAEPVGQPERVILKELILESGVRLHFETSAKGACVYYIEEPGPSCVEVVEHELASTTAEGGHQDREEAGRAPQAESRTSEGAERAASELRAPELPDSECVSTMPETGDVRAGVVSGHASTGSDPNVRV